SAPVPSRLLSRGGVRSALEYSSSTIRQSLFSRLCAGYSDFTCCGGLHVYQLQFRNNTARCMGLPAGSGEVTVRDCSGGDTTNTNWAKGPVGSGEEMWENTSLKVYLASHDIDGDQLFVTTTSCSPGCFLKWDVLALP